MDRNSSPTPVETSKPMDVPSTDNRSGVRRSNTLPDARTRSRSLRTPRRQGSQEAAYEQILRTQAYHANTNQHEWPERSPSVEGSVLILRSPRTGVHRNTSSSSLGTDELHLSDSQSETGEYMMSSAADPHSPSTPATTSFVDDRTGVEYIEHTLPIVECPPDVHVALMDRPREMVDLLEFNGQYARRVKAYLGDEVYEKLYQMWTQVPRSKMTDLEWLTRSHRSFIEHGCLHFWTEFTHVVGYENDCNLDWDPDTVQIRHKPLEILEEEEE